MSQPEFDELMHSPLDEPSRSRWWPVVVGGLIGAVATAAVFIAAGSDNPEQDSSAAVVSTRSTTTVMMPPTEPSPFPLGYVAVSDTEAFKPHHVAITEDRIVVTMTTSYARDLDPSNQPWFLGGTWMLDTASEGSIVSEATLFDDHVPGGFSVVFPVLTGTTVEPEQLRLVERWEPMQSTATVDVPRDGLPGQRLPSQLGERLEPLLVPMDGFALRFDRIVIPGIGEVVASWALEGDPQPRGVVSLESEMMGPDEWLIATGQPFAESVRPFGLDGSQGTTGIQMVPTSPLNLYSMTDLSTFLEELELVEGMIIHCTVTTADRQPIDEVVFSLPMSN